MKLKETALLLWSDGANNPLLVPCQGVTPSHTWTQKAVWCRKESYKLWILYCSKPVHSCWIWIWIGTELEVFCTDPTHVRLESWPSTWGRQHDRGGFYPILGVWTGWKTVAGCWLRRGKTCRPTSGSTEPEVMWSQDWLAETWRRKTPNLKDSSTCVSG